MVGQQGLEANKQECKHWQSATGAEKYCSACYADKKQKLRHGHGHRVDTRKSCLQLMYSITFRGRHYFGRKPPLCNSQPRRWLKLLIRVCHPDETRFSRLSQVYDTFEEFPEA